LVNTHHHLYQWATRGYAVDAPLFQWLTDLYPVWAGLDENTTRWAAAAGLARLASTGCTTAADHHYLFPTDGGDVLGAVAAAAQPLGCRPHVLRCSMHRGRSDGCLPSDSVVGSPEDALVCARRASARFPAPAPRAMVRVAVGPSSPFTATTDLLRRSA